MSDTIAIVVFLVLLAAAAAVRVAAHYRYRARGRPDLEWGHAGAARPAEALARARHLTRLVEGDDSGSPARTKTHPAALRPVFHIGATPAPEGVSPWPSDEHIRREFDPDSPENRGHAA